MPCRDWEGMTEADNREMRMSEYHRQEVQGLQSRNDTLTQMLCTLLTCVEQSPTAYQGLPATVKEWWETHKRLDAEQAARELAEQREEEYRRDEKERRRQLILRATAKLSPDELQAVRDGE